MRLEIEPITPSYVDSAINDPQDHDRRSEAAETLKRGIAAAQAGNRRAARTELLRTTELDPRSESAWLWLASISEYPEELMVFLNNVLDINPSNERALEWKAATKGLLARTFVQRGIDAAESGNRDFAVQCFNQALEQDQSNAMAWLWLSSLCESQEGKISYLEKVLEIEPENETALAAFAKAKEEVNQKLLAEARSAFVSGRKDEAHELLDAFIAENPESEDGWILRSHLSDDFTGKVAAFEKVLTFNPGSPAARAGLESLKAIMEGAGMPMPIPSEPDGMENTAMAVNTARTVEDDDVHAKSPTEELVFPEAAKEMAEANESVVFEPADAVEEETEFGSQVSEGIVYFEPLSSAEDLEEPAVEVVAEEQHEEVHASVVEEAPEVHPSEEAYPEEVHASADVLAAEEAHTDDHAVEAEAAMVETPAHEVVEEHSANDGNDAQWGMNTVAFTFAFPGGADDAVVEETSGRTDAEEPVSEPAVYASPFDEKADAANAEDDALIEKIDFVDDNFEVSAEDLTPVPVPFGSIEDGDQFGIDDDAFAEQIFKPLEPMVAEQPGPVVANEVSAIPMPADLPAEPVFTKTGFETTLVTSHSELGLPVSVLKCPYCGSDNPLHAFSCGVCLATLTLSDLEMLIANNHADRAVIKSAVDTLEAHRAERPLSESDLTNLGIGYLNLRDLDKGYAYLHEASQMNPNNVVLASQVNSLLIRIEEIRRQEAARDAMPREKKILVVDDSATVRKLIAGKLEKCGHEVYCAADGVDALEQLDKVVPDLILLDITMPRMDGYQVCKVIRSKDVTKDVPVVMISGKDGFFDKVRGRMAGSTGYITKPFGPETLMKAVETYLKGEVMQ